MQLNAEKWREIFILKFKMADIKMQIFSEDEEISRISDGRHAKKATRNVLKSFSDVVRNILHVLYVIFRYSVRFSVRNTESPQ